jgi:dTDP-4-dehydrorhamnose reductase
MIIRQKIMVTGAEGQAGKELQQLSLVYPQYDFIFLTRKELSIDDEKAVRDVLQKEMPQYLVNCAAYTAVDKAEEEQEQAFLVNAAAVGILAKACSEHNCYFIHLSTDYVFDGTAKLPYKETDAVNPQSVYGRSKLQGEELAVNNNPGSLIIRTSWVYSAFGKNFLRTMIRLMAEKKEIGVVNDQFGSPTYAADLAEAILNIISSQKWEAGIYHFSNEGMISWYDFATAIKQVTGSNCMIKPITTVAYPTPAKRPAFSVLDHTRITSVFGIIAKPWLESLRECISRIDIESGIN